MTVDIDDVRDRLGLNILSRLVDRAMVALEGVEVSGCIEHHNGFKRVAFATDDLAGERLWLHVWSSDTPARDVHSHRWSYESVVLRGALVHSEYEEVAGSARFEKFVHTLESDRQDAASSLIYVGDVDAELASTITLSPGDRHVAHPAALHQAHGAVPGSITAVLRGRSVQRTSTVLRPKSEAADPGAISTRRLSLSEITDALGDVAAAIDRLL